MLEHALQPTRVRMRIAALDGRIVIARLLCSVEAFLCKMRLRAASGAERSRRWAFGALKAVVNVLALLADQEVIDVGSFGRRVDLWRVPVLLLGIAIKVGQCWRQQREEEECGG